MKHPNEAIQRYGLHVHTELETPICYALNKDTELYDPDCCSEIVATQYALCSKYTKLKFIAVSFPGCMASAEALKSSLVCVGKTMSFSALHPILTVYALVSKTYRDSGRPLKKAFTSLRSRDAKPVSQSHDRAKKIRFA